jgi:hypothetical protein
MAAQRIPEDQYRIVVKDQVVFHLINDDYPYGVNMQAPQPASISLEPPKVKKPPFPAATQTSLQSAKPAIFYADFNCAKHCRSLGICIHYQFVLGSKRCPDALICDACKRPGIEQVVSLTLNVAVPSLTIRPQANEASRACPMHYRPDAVKALGSRPEDFLATNAQAAVAREILRRSMENDWDDLDEDTLPRYGYGNGIRKPRPAQATRVKQEPTTTSSKDAEDSARQNSSSLYQSSSYNGESDGAEQYPRSEGQSPQGSVNDQDQNEGPFSPAAVEGKREKQPQMMQDDKPFSLAALEAEWEKERRLMQDEATRRILERGIGRGLG